MPDLIIKPTATSGNKLILKDQAGGAVLTTADSGATAANVTLASTTVFPSGKVSNVFRLSDNTSGEYQANVDSSAAKVPADAMSWSAISGRHYLVNSQSIAQPWANGTSSSGRTQTTRLYVGTTNRSEGDTQASTSTDTLLFDAYIGRNPVDSGESNEDLTKVKLLDENIVGR